MDLANPKRLLHIVLPTAVNWYIHDRYTYFILNTLLDETAKIIFLTLKKKSTRS